MCKGAKSCRNAADSIPSGGSTQELATKAGFLAEFDQHTTIHQRLTAPGGACTRSECNDLMSRTSRWISAIMHDPPPS